MYTPGITLNGRRIEWLEWSLLLLAIAVSLSLTAGMVFLVIQDQVLAPDYYAFSTKEWTRALVGVVLLFDIYTVHRQLLLQRLRRELYDHHQLFRVITENAIDMISVLDRSGRCIYNSPSYTRVLGYTLEELAVSPPLSQVHPADRLRLSKAMDDALKGDSGQRLEYRMRRKDGSWCDIESTASPVKNALGAIDDIVIVNRDITQRKRVEERLAHSLIYDGLTQLPNRSLFLDRLDRALGRARRHPDSRFAVLFVDLDNFKVVNDSLGHKAGDELLQKVAARLATGFRESDSVGRPLSNTFPEDVSVGSGVARFAGDEFAVLLEEIVNPSDAIRIAERLQARLRGPFRINGQEVVLSASVGAALSSSRYCCGEDLLRDAETAMYRAKTAGAGHFEIFDSRMHVIAVRRFTIENELRRGIEQGDLLVYYQPIISLSTGKITGFEALSRWKTPRGVLPPSEFISIADDTGLIVSLNRELYMKACRQIRQWQELCPNASPLTISLNVSSKQFARADLVSDIRTTVETSGIPPHSVEIEIMETVAMNDPELGVARLNELKDLGVRLSIDDFGTGHSSLSRLLRFPLDSLKVDRAFISGMTQSRERSEIVELIISLARNLKVDVIAEGVECEPEADRLRELGCTKAQGYYFSPAVSEENATKLLTEGIGMTMEA